MGKGENEDAPNSLSWVGFKFGNFFEKTLCMFSPEFLEGVGWIELERFKIQGELDSWRELR